MESGATQINLQQWRIYIKKQTKNSTKKESLCLFKDIHLNFIGFLLGDHLTSLFIGTLIPLWIDFKIYLYIYVTN